MGVMPYTDRECSTQPTTRQKANAASYKIKEWQGLPSTDTLLIKRALVEKHPVAFGVNVDEGFNYLQPPYIWKERTDRGEGHGMVVIGYDDSKHAFRIQNSWSRGWADEGRAWIDYTFFVENVYPAMYIVL
jgi:C1A family cysteine protease